ncbi:MAG: ATP-dependent helicase [bacterium]|nr:ATP-dependent helicase [bacterium]
MREFVLSPTTGKKEIDFEKELNDEQRQVVLQGDGPCLVLAGAGSGKTRAITYRVAFLLNKGVLPQNILLLTFTNKAAAEMISRIESLFGSYPTGLWSGTFHSIANRLLRKYAPALGYTSDFTIIDQDDSKALVKACISELKIDTKTNRFPSPAVLVSIISYSRNAQMSIEDVLERKHPSFLPLQFTIKQISDLYRSKKKEGNTMDFDDLLLNLLRLLTERPDIASQLSEQFEYILVDEFQDTNTVQATIIQELAACHKNIFVVGDDAQSIYSFRAADIKNILNFPNWFPGTQTFRLTSNYRSTPNILDLANASIAQNVDQYKKELNATRKAWEKPSLVPARSASQEAQYISEQILSLHTEGLPLSEISVLFRSAFHSQVLEMELTKRDIPYEFRGGLRFFERAQIKDVVSYLRIIVNPTDEIAWMRVLSHQPGIGLVTAGKIFKAVREKGFLGDILETDIKLPARAKKGWEGFVGVATRLVDEHLPASIIQSLAASEYKDYLESQYPDYLERLEDIEQFALFAEGYTNLSEFLTEVTLRDDFGAARENGQNEEVDRLVLSTIHQAKGLEWDAVFIMRLQEGAFPHKRSLGERGGLEEERRLFYVAVTRARKHLFLTYPIQSGFDTMIINQPSSFIQEVPRRLLEEVRLKESYKEKRRSSYSDDPWDREPTIILDDIGERLSKPIPTSFLKDI